MKTFELNQEAQALAHRPQIERFRDDKFYVIETWADYDALPANIKEWRFLIANI